MKISLENLISNPNVDKGTTTYSASAVRKTENTGAYALDITGIVKDNTAYQGQGKTTEDVMLGAATMNVAVAQDYMMVMSNCMSEEDFAKLQEEGYKPFAEKIETVVTVVDKIKASLIEAGVIIEGYTDSDSVSMSELESIVGDKARAVSLVKKLQEKDMPVTKENVKTVNDALNKALTLEPIQEGSAKHMVTNQMEPTLGNVYKAQFSGAGDSNRQGKGYYADELNGYYAKKAEDIDFESLRPQMEKVIAEAGADLTQGTLEEATWLIEKGVPLTKENFLILQSLKNVNLPQKEETLIDTIVSTIASGKPADKALLDGNYNIRDKAVKIYKAVNEITEEAIEMAVSSKKEITIKSILNAQGMVNEYMAPHRDEAYLAKVKRKVEELRLHMTVEANLVMLKKGMAIDTTPLEEVVEKLKQAEEEAFQLLLGKSAEENIVGKGTSYYDTLCKIAQIPSLPADVVGKITAETALVSLNYVHTQGTNLKNAYEEAGKTYEALMTAPRRDMGDSIQKAFRNVDALLENIALEATESNQRAVRILGYNSMEITTENIMAVKIADASLQRVVQKMTPAATLQMIRDGLNPLEVSLEELEDYFTAQETNLLDKGEKYSKFLYKLDQNKEITPEEKEAYLGMYRLLRQIEKGDGAALGTIVEQGANLTFKNLLTGIRSDKKKGMEVVLDDKFGGLEKVVKKGKSISSEIENYYSKTAGEIADSLEPLENEQKKEAEKSYRRGQLEEITNFHHMDESVIKEVIDSKQPVTIDNLLAAQFLKQNKGSTFQTLKKSAKQIDESKLEKTLDQSSLTENAQERIFDKIEQSFAQLQESLVSKEDSFTAYEEIAANAGEVLEKAIDTTGMGLLDIKAITAMYKQISYCTGKASQENYEVPVTINGETTAINLRIIHGREEKGKVEATVNTMEYGEIQAEFRVRGEKVYGIFIAENLKGMEAMEQMESNFSQALRSEGLEVREFHYSLNKNTNTWAAEKAVRTKQPMNQEENKDATSQETEQISTKQLYKIAKNFICTLQNNVK